MHGCKHEWREGGNRDRGRYHCARCYQCMDPMWIVHERDHFQRALQLALGLDEPPTYEACKRYIEDYEARAKEAKDGE